MTKKRILILTPDLRLLGGVTNHYLGLKPHWTYNIKYVTYGKRVNVHAAIVLPIDILIFLWQLIFWRPNVVVVNPSFRYYQLVRDGVYLMILNLFKIKFVTFFHGWDFNVGSFIKKNSKIFNMIYGNSKFIYVLSKDFKEQLNTLEMSCPILLTTTKFDNNLIKNFNINNRNGEVKNILFLARVEEKKGIYIVLEAFNILTKKYPDIHLTIVGPGNGIKKAKNLVNNMMLENVKFTGPLRDKDLITELENGDIYILPSYSEGMPTTILEAMAFGMPIITRPVGGIKDFFIEDKMGFLVESLEPKDFAVKMEKLLQNKNLARDMGHYNYRYAIDNFAASSVAGRIEKDMRNYAI